MRGDAVTAKRKWAASMGSKTSSHHPRGGRYQLPGRAPVLVANNTSSTLELASMARDFKKLHLFVRVSTPYVHSFLEDGEVAEEVYQVGDPEKEIADITAGRGSGRFEAYPWPYRYSKHLTEQLLAIRFSRFPLLIGHDAEKYVEDRLRLAVKKVKQRCKADDQSMIEEARLQCPWGLQGNQDDTTDVFPRDSERNALGTTSTPFPEECQQNGGC
ncbi:hypothetical protein DL767_003146 [Monosporascus sp. MG133]|nr:hypothetical protein DL767_003146 [Monosporascus sp. MG133]